MRKNKMKAIMAMVVMCAMLVSPLGVMEVQADNEPVYPIGPE